VNGANVEIRHGKIAAAYGPSGCGGTVGPASHVLGEMNAVTEKVTRGLIRSVKTLGADVKKLGKKERDPGAVRPSPTRRGECVGRGC
jgi:hypothetical protein